MNKLYVTDVLGVEGHITVCRHSIHVIAIWLVITKILHTIASRRKPLHDLKLQQDQKVRVKLSLAVTIQLQKV